MISCKSWEDAIIPPSASLETAKKLTFLRENSDFIYPRLKERFVEIVREFGWACRSTHSKPSKLNLSVLDAFGFMALRAFAFLCETYLPAIAS